MFIVGHCRPVRGAARSSSGRGAAAQGPLRPHALSAPGYVGMGQGADRSSKLPSRADLPIVSRLAGARRTQRHRSRPCNDRHESPRPEVTMNAHLKVQPHHLERGAYLYIRQSSMRQVVENAESARRQYALRGRAVALGWRDEQIIVVDNDQGESGASAAWREGFQRLVSDVGVGHAGIVMGLEVSRLARNNADWQRLLEICALADTLILDEDGVYDPASFNDRMLLGLKGTMSEAELHILKSRLQGGILNKARRGELAMPLPIRLVYTPDARVVLDPDRQIQDTVRLLFDTFRETGSACAVVRRLRGEKILFPRRIRRGIGKGDILWNEIDHSRVLQILHNPRHAGAFAYGRTRTAYNAKLKPV